MDRSKARLRWLVAAVILLSAVVPLRAQDKSSAPTDSKKLTALKIEIVVNEFDGTKKVSSLPYMFYVNADDRGGGANSQLRSGLRVPISLGQTGSSANQSSQYQYMDIGTNLDCRADSATDNKFKLQLSLDRSYLYSPGDGDKKSSAGEGVSISSGNPIVAHFSSSYNLIVRDGQTVEATTTSDPVSGHILQVLVTATSVK